MTHLHNVPAAAGKLYPPPAMGVTMAPEARVRAGVPKGPRLALDPLPGQRQAAQAEAAALLHLLIHDNRLEFVERGNTILVLASLTPAEFERLCAFDVDGDPDAEADSDHEPLLEDDESTHDDEIDEHMEDDGAGEPSLSIMLPESMDTVAATTGGAA